MYLSEHVIFQNNWINNEKALSISEQKILLFFFIFILNIMIPNTDCSGKYWLQWHMTLGTLLEADEGMGKKIQFQSKITGIISN